MEAAMIYQKELDRCGFKSKLEYAPVQNVTQKRRRSRRVTWFNPPYSVGVDTDMGREFLLLIDKHFKKDSILRSAMNRTTIRVSYRCLPNLGAKISGHNKKILERKAKAEVNVKTGRGGKGGCNCFKSRLADCPIPGACNSDGVVYQATVESVGGKKGTYVGLAQNFKIRFNGHKATLGDKKKENGNTALSVHYWNEKKAGNDPKIKWAILD